jgi:hypothetical protein
VVIASGCGLVLVVDMAILVKMNGYPAVSEASAQQRRPCSRRG